MSTHGTLTVGRNARIPMWPFVAVVLAVAVAVVGLTVALRSSDRTPEPARSVVTTDVLENSSAAIREGGAYATGEAAVTRLVPADLATDQAALARARYAAIARLGMLDPADFASEQADRVRARFAAMAGLGGDATTGPIVIGGWVCHQCR